MAADSHASGHPDWTSLSIGFSWTTKRPPRAHFLGHRKPPLAFMGQCKQLLASAFCSQICGRQVYRMPDIGSIPFLSAFVSCCNRLLSTVGSCCTVLATQLGAPSDSSCCWSCSKFFCIPCMSGLCWPASCGAVCSSQGHSLPSVHLGGLSAGQIFSEHVIVGCVTFVAGMIALASCVLLAVNLSPYLSLLQPATRQQYIWFAASLKQVQPSCFCFAVSL